MEDLTHLWAQTARVGPTGMPTLGLGGAEFTGWVDASPSVPPPIDPNLMPELLRENLQVVSQIKTGPPL